MKTPWTLTLAVLLLAGCDTYAFQGVPTDDGDRAVAVAEEIVTGMARRYADIYHEGTMRAFAVDPAYLDWASDPELSDWGYISVPVLEDALRRVAEQFSSERAPWLLMIEPVAKTNSQPDVPYSFKRR